MKHSTAHSQLNPPRRTIARAQSQYSVNLIKSTTEKYFMSTNKCTCSPHTFIHIRIERVSFEKRNAKILCANIKNVYSNILDICTYIVNKGYSSM